MQYSKFKLGIPEELWDRFEDDIAEAIEIGGGIQSQYYALSEEASELAVASSHRRRERIDKSEFLEEKIDTVMMIIEFLFLEGYTQQEVDDMMKKKLNKFHEWVLKEKDGAKGFYERKK